MSDKRDKGPNSNQAGEKISNHLLLPLGELAEAVRDVQHGERSEGAAGEGRVVHGGERGFKEGRRKVLQRGGQSFFCLFFVAFLLF